MYPMMNFETLCNVYNVCIVPWVYLGYREGLFSTVGDIMINMGDILSIMGVFSTVDIMSIVGDIMSTVGCSVPWGTKNKRLLHPWC